MKRIAVIIGSSLPISHPDHLRGVSEDVLNFKKFLISANGGAWEQDELIELINPSLREIEKAKHHQNNCDSALTFFSGHGCMKGRENYLDINSYDSINYLKLFPSAKRSLVVMDACRTDYAYEHLEGIYGLGLEFDKELRRYAKAIYIAALSKTPHGRIAIFSTAANKPSMDTDNGGAFTVELFSQTVAWINARVTCYLPLKTIFDNTKRGLQGYDYPQIPEMRYTGKEMLIFPVGTNPKVLTGRNVNGRVNNTLSKNQKKRGGMDIYIIS
jgi:hypothetical protein